MMSFVQKITVDCGRHKFPMTPRMARKDVLGIVTFDLISLLPTNHIIIIITVAYWSL